MKRSAWNLSRTVSSAGLLSLLFAAPSLAAIPTNGLVAAYSFSGNAQDSGPNGLHGTVHGAVLTADRFGHANSAYAFNGTNAYIEVGDNDVFSVNTTGFLSISVWMRPDVLQFPISPSGYVHWMGKGDVSGTNGNQEWALRMYNHDGIPPPDDTRTNRVSFYVFNLTGGLGAGSYVQETVTAGTWYHYVAVVNTPANTITWYKNGVQKDQDTFTGPPFDITPENGAAPVRIGTRDLNSYFEGAIDDINIYNRALTATEIQNLYHDVPASSPGITSIVRTNNDILITWLTGVGKTNALQVTSGGAGGVYNTNGFANLFVLINVVGTVTNYLDVGGATNEPARYYRLRLVP